MSFLSKSKKRSAKAVRTVVRKQLQYIRRDVGYVVKLIQNGAELSQKQEDRLNVVKEVYLILLDMALHSEADIHTDEQGRRYLAFFNKTIAVLIDRTPSTIAQSLRELEDAGLVEKKLIARSEPYHLYVKLPAEVDEP